MFFRKCHYTYINHLLEKKFTNGNQENHWSCLTFTRGQQRNNCFTDYGWNENLQVCLVDNNYTAT